MSDFTQKLSISVYSGIMLLVINSPYAYSFTKMNDGNNCPNITGRLLHMMLFLVLTFLTMPKLKEDTLLKVKRSVYGALIGFFIFSPELCMFIGKYVNTMNNNCLNNNGMMLHTLLYILSLVGVMYLPNE